MTWLSRISFSLLAAGCATAAQLSGRVELADSQDAGVRKHQNFAGVVVWLEAPDLKPAAPRRAEMRQKRKTFQPHVLAIPAGSTVDFPNFDPIFHNAFSNFSGQTFDVGLYAPGTNRSVHFRRPGIVRVFCNIHPAMSAIIAVFQTPYFAVTDRKGQFEIVDVAPGYYRLKFFHERASTETLDKLERPVKIDPAGLRLPPVRISESGYISIPHKNKYGKEYPAAAEDHILYPGAKK